MMATIVDKEGYNALPNFDAVKEAVSSGALDVADALKWETEGKGRKLYLAYFNNPTEQEGTTAPAAPAAPTPSAEKPQEQEPTPNESDDFENLETASDLTAMLLANNQKSALIMEQRERVRNRALPNDPGEIFDWPEKELEYKWVPYFTPKRALHPLEHSKLRQMVRSGWDFYDSRYMNRRPNANGYPWHPSWEEVESKVMFDDQVLMYRSSEYEARQRKYNTDKKKESRQKMKEEGRKVDDDTGHSYTVVSQSGETTVDKLLREGKNKANGEGSFVQPGNADAY